MYFNEQIKEINFGKMITFSYRLLLKQVNNLMVEGKVCIYVAVIQIAAYLYIYIYIYLVKQLIYLPILATSNKKVVYFPIPTCI